MDPSASPSLTVILVYFTPDRAGSTDPRASPSLIVTFDLGTVGYNDQLQLYNILNRAVNSGQIAQYSVSPTGLAFRPLRGKRYNQYSSSPLHLIRYFFINSNFRVLFQFYILCFFNYMVVSFSSRSRNSTKFKVRKMCLAICSIN